LLVGGAAAERCEEESGGTTQQQNTGVPLGFGRQRVRAITAVNWWVPGGCDRAGIIRGVIYKTNEIPKSVVFVKVERKCAER
jgi:hypothetical protein